MKIFILGHLIPGKDGEEDKWKATTFHSGRKYRQVVIEEPGLLDLVNAQVERYHRDTYVDTLENDEGAKIQIEDPLEVDQTFMWDESLFGFVDENTLALRLNHTGEGVLKRFVETLKNEVKEKENSNNFFSNFITWTIVSDLPYSVKKDSLIDFNGYRAKKSSLSQDNFWVTKKIIKFSLSGIEFYVKGQSIFYDPEDEDVNFALETGSAKDTILKYISEHDSEMKPQQVVENNNNNEEN
jgi:hypothetical protein